MFLTQRTVIKQSHMATALKNAKVNFHITFTNESFE